MRRSAALLLCGLFLTASASADEAGWTSLFDGKTLAGWKSYTGKPIGSQWVVEDGAIHLAAGGEYRIEVDDARTTVGVVRGRVVVRVCVPVGVARRSSGAVVR
jgi:hypothetical protein